jgi:hypothetical protein
MTAENDSTQSMLKSVDVWTWCPYSDMSDFCLWR